jgi:hypothetical protein
MQMKWRRATTSVAIRIAVMLGIIVGTAAVSIADRMPVEIRELREREGF